MSFVLVPARFRLLDSPVLRAIGGMLALASAMGIGRFVYTPILPEMAGALGLTKTGAGLIASANFAGYLAGAVLAMLPALAARRRDWFVGALVLGAATTAAMGLVATMPAFMALRFCGGAASAFVLVLGSALVLDQLAAAGRSSLAAVHFAGVGVGIAASALLVDAMQAQGAEWRVLWLACGAIAGAAALVAAWLVPETNVSVRAATMTQTVVRATHRGLGRLSLCHGLFGFGYVVTATFLVAAVRGAPQARGLEAVVWVIVGLAAIPSTALWARLGGRFGVLRAYGVACVFEAAGVVAGGIWPESAGAVVAALLLGGTFMGITALGFAAARGLAPDQHRRAFALITAGFGVGQILGPVIAGWLIDRTGGFLLPSLIAAAALLTSAVVAATTPHG